MNKWSILFAGLLINIGARDCTAQSMFRGDPQHSGVLSAKAPREFHRIKWTFPTGDRVVSSPVFEDDTIYFGGDDGNVYAVETSGRQKWKQTTDGPVPATPAVV